MTQAEEKVSCDIKGKVEPCPLGKGEKCKVFCLLDGEERKTPSECKSEDCCGTTKYERCEC